MIWIIYLLALVVILLAGYISKHYSIKLINRVKYINYNPRKKEVLLWWSIWLQSFSSAMGATIITTTLLVILIGIAQQNIQIKVLNDQLRDQLILQMGSPVNDLALEATRELRIKGWLEDGSLISAQLPEANLLGANLRYANLSKANLSNAILNEVWLTNANLQYVKLGRATMEGAKLIGTNLRGSFMYMANLPEFKLIIP